MQFKRRKNTVQLYRSRWVPKGAAGNARGFPDPIYIGSLADASQEIPADLLAKLSDAEQAQVESRVLEPARRVAAEELRRAERRERDPCWRVDEAARLLREAAERSAGATIPSSVMASIAAAMSCFPSAGGEKASSMTECDSLKAALAAIQGATNSVSSGRFGKVSDNVRKSGVYGSWREIVEAHDQLQGALQLQGWVKKKGTRAD